MLNQQEERPLSIGSAVQFTHKGETISGHLLQRQGRRRFAKVIDTEERIWKVPESALKHSGGTRRATMVTRYDKVRADYRVGDEVTFTSRGRTKAWRDREAQPRREQRYAVKRHAGTSPMACSAWAGKESARNGAERLNGVAGMARRLMDDHGLTGWTLAFVEAKRRLGDCHFRHRVIRISRTHALGGSKEQIRDTVLHEIAHAIAGRRGGPWTAVEGNGTANRSNTKGEGLREPSELRQG